MLIAVTLIAGLAVFTRYVLNNALTWTEEVARYCLIWITMIGTSLAIRYRNHISLDTIVQRLPKRTSTIIEIIFFLIIIILIGVLVRSSFIMVFTQSTLRYSPTLGITMFWVQIILPVGFALTLIHSLFIILEDIKKLLTGKS